MEPLAGDPGAGLPGRDHFARRGPPGVVLQITQGGLGLFLWKRWLTARAKTRQRTGEKPSTRPAARPKTGSAILRHVVIEAPLIDDTVTLRPKPMREAPPPPVPELVGPMPNAQRKAPPVLRGWRG